MPDYRAIIVGAGGISRAWIGPLLQEGVQVPAVVDTRVQMAERRIAEFSLSAEATDNLAGALERHRPDFVVDLTPPEAHCCVTCAALEAGCHVIGEKPMSCNMDQARKMVATAERTGRLYMVSQSRRWNPHHEAIRRVVRDGKLGRLSVVNCDFYMGAHFGGFRAEMPSPLVLDMAIHHFDLARYMTGTDPVAVYAHEFNPAGSWYKGAAAASCIFEMTDGVVLTYCGSWCAEGCATSWNGNWRLVGERGTLLYENDQPPRGQVVVDGGTEILRAMKPLDVPAPTLQHEGMHGALREMLAFMDTGHMPQTECHDNIKSLAMVFAAMESSRQGERTQVRT